MLIHILELLCIGSFSCPYLHPASAAADSACVVKGFPFFGKPHLLLCGAIIRPSLHFVEGRHRWLALTQPWLQLIVEAFSIVCARSRGCVVVFERSLAQSL